MPAIARRENLPYDEPLWKDALYYASKSLEWIVKGTAQTMGLKNNKYKFGEGKGFSDQVTFIDLSQDLMEKGGIDAPRLAFALGLTADFFLDPIGKLRVAGALTRAGVAGDLAKVAKSAGYIDDATGLINRTKVLEGLKASKASIKANVGRLGKSSARRLLKIQRHRAQSVVKNLDETNRFLKQEYAKGRKLEDLLLKENKIERILEGQENFLGFTGIFGGTPFRLRDRFSRATRSLLPVTRSMQAGLYAPIAAAGSGIGKILKHALSVLRIDLPDSTKNQLVTKAFRKAFRTEERGTIRAVQQAVWTWMDIFRLDKRNAITKLREITNLLEVEGAAVETRVLQKIIVEAPDSVLEGKYATSLGLSPVEITKKIGDSDLTNQQKLLVNPSGVAPGDARRAVDRRVASTAFVRIPHGDLYVDNDFVVIKTTRPEAFQIPKLNVPGVSKWHKVEREGAVYLVAPNYGTALSGSVGAWHLGHIANLERIAALMSRKSYALKIIEPADVLIGKAGEVQIVNPKVIEKVESTKLAREVSLRHLQAFQASIQDVPASGFPALRSGKAANKVKPAHLKFSNLSIEPDAVAKIDARGELEWMNPRLLLNAANNTDEIILADRVDLERMGALEFAEQVRQNPDELLPVHVSIDFHGNVEIVSDEDLIRLAGYAHAGAQIDAIPVVLVPFTGDVAKGLKQQTVSLAHARPLKEVMEDLHSSVDQALKLGDPSVTSATDLDRTAKVYNRAGELIQRSSPIQAADVSMVWNSFLDMMGRLFAGGSRVTRTRREINANILRKAFGSRENASLQLARLASESDDITEFFSGLKAIAPDITIPPDLAQVSFERAFEVFQNAGFGLANRALRAGALHTGIGARSPLVVSGLGESRILVRQVGNTLEFVNPNLRHAELSKFANDYVLQRMRDLDPGTEIIIHSAETSSQGLAKTILGTAKKDLTLSIKPSQLRFHINPDIEKSWRANQVYLRPTKEETKALGLARVPGPRQPFQYFFSRSGELVLSANRKHATIRGLLYAAFGRRRYHAQEFGQILRDTIYLSNPFGAQMARLGKAELRALEKRLKHVAQQFIDSGIDPDFVLEIIPEGVGLPEQIWTMLYKGKRGNKMPRLADIVSDDWKIRVPRDFDDFPLKPLSPRGTIRITDPIERLPEGKYKEFARRYRDETDAMFRAEIEQGLPTRYRRGYFARFLDPKLQEHFNAVWQKFMAKNPAKFSYWMKHFKKRVFTDLTVDEINDLWKQMKNPFADGTLMTHLRKHEADFLRKVMNEAPDAAQFFIDNPILSLALRSIASTKSRARHGFLTELGDKVAIWKGTASDYESMRGINDRIELANAQRLKHEARAEELHTMLETVSDDKAKASLLKKVEAADNSAKVQAVKHVKLLEERTRIGGPLVSDLGEQFNRLGTVTITIDDAKALAAQGKISKDLLANFANDPFVDIPVDLFRDKLVKFDSKIKFYLFDQEVMDKINQLWGITKSQEGSKSFWKHHDRLLDIFRQTTLFPFPKYFSRNFLSNIFLSVLGGITDLDGFRVSTVIGRIMRKVDAGVMSLDEADDLLKSITMVSDAGVSSNLFDFYREFQLQGGLTGGIHYVETGMGRTPEKLEKVFQEGGVIPARKLTIGQMLTENMVVRGGRRVNAAMENWFRMAAFYKGWRTGGTFEDAGRLMKTVFYNYDELTPWERTWARRILPFYTWSRFNIPRMFQTFATEPVIHYRFQQILKDWQRTEGIMTSDERAIPKWMSDRYGIPVKRGKDGTLYFLLGDGFFPFADAARVFRDVTSLAKGGSNAQSMFTDMVTPFLKIPLEQLFNESLFTRTELERAPGEPARSWTLRGLGFTRRGQHRLFGVIPMDALTTESVVTDIRAVNESLKWIDWLADNEKKVGRPTFTARLLDFIVGRLYASDPDRASYFLNLEFEKNVSRAKRFVRSGLRTKNQELERFGRKWLQKLVTEYDGSR